ncbi:MAG TPA: hypothetical protein GX736_04185 [Mogibacterium sp.]|nr:hypothetical protein [Mogibacterium sp.]
MSDDSIKVMTLLDELEELISSSKKSFMSQNVLIDGEMAHKIIEDIRLNLPRDIQQANWVSREKDRIISDAKSEYNKVIVSAKNQAEYLIDTNMIKKEAQKRADAILSEAENHANYIKLRTYEYVDKLLFDMQNDISSIGSSYIQPMNEYFSDIIGNINIKVNHNRQEMKNLAERVQLTDSRKEEE